MSLPFSIPRVGSSPQSRRSQSSEVDVAFHAQFVKLRPSDLRPIPVSLPVELVATSQEQAIEKLKRLVDLGRWPTLADAVRLFEDGVEVDSFIPTIDKA